MNNVMQYLDSLATTINLRLDAPVPNFHPCQKCSDKFFDDKQNYIELVNKLQRYIWYNLFYYLHVDHCTGQQYCKFDYLKDLMKNTYLHDDNGQPELITIKNDLYDNSHDRLQL